MNYSRIPLPASGSLGKLWRVSPRQAFVPELSMEISGNWVLPVFGFIDEQSDSDSKQEGNLLNFHSKMYGT